MSNVMVGSLELTTFILDDHLVWSLSNLRALRYLRSLVMQNLTVTCVPGPLNSVCSLTSMACGDGITKPQLRTLLTPSSLITSSEEDIGNSSKRRVKRMSSLNWAWTTSCQNGGITGFWWIHKGRRNGGRSCHHDYEVMHKALVPRLNSLMLSLPVVYDVYSDMVIYWFDEPQRKRKS